MSENYESQLTERGQQLINELNGKFISKQSDLDEAIEWLQQVKQMNNDVTAYWEPLKKTAYASYTSVQKKMKEVVTPLDQCERKIKDMISDYIVTKENEALTLAGEITETNRRKAAQMRIDAEKLDDNLSKELMMYDADVLESQIMTIPAQYSLPKGISKTAKTIVSKINPDDIPAEINGVSLWKIDEKAIENLVKSGISIPGVTTKKTYTIKVTL